MQKMALRLCGSYRTTADADPKQLYRNELVAVDASRNLNNGLPSGLALWIDSLDLHEGDSVLHVGCGVGYYTAIMAEVVGDVGKVLSVEIDPTLAARAQKNLAYLKHVRVLHGDGAEQVPGSTDAIFINAGATRPRSVWLDCLRPGGRLLLPLTTDTWQGGMLRVERGGQGYSARFISTVSVFPCIGSRDKESNQRLGDALMRGEWRAVRSLRREPHQADDTCWLHGGDFCLSKLPHGR